VVTQRIANPPLCSQKSKAQSTTDPRNVSRTYPECANWQLLGESRFIAERCTGQRCFQAAWQGCVGSVRVHDRSIRRLGPGARILALHRVQKPLNPRDQARVFVAASEEVCAVGAPPALDIFLCRVARRQAQRIPARRCQAGRRCINPRAGYGRS